MNWMGGSRSRIRTQNERKLQREFFERKKFADKVQVYRSIGGTGIRKHGLGQDLRAFQTVNVAHSHHKVGCDTTSRPVKKVDLDVFKPAFSRMVEDINLGTVSPTSSVSKISLNEPKYETKEANELSSFVKPENQIDMKTSKSSVKFEPYSSPNPYKFKKPEPKLKFQFKDYDRSFPNKFQHKDLEPETPRLESFHESYMSEKNSFKYSLFNTDNQQNINQITTPHKHLLDRKNKNLHKDSSNDLPIAQFDKSLSSQRSSNGLNVKFCERTTEIHVPSNYSKSKHKRAFEKYDKNISQKSSEKRMFVSEDFQITPLRKYQQESESPQRPNNTQKRHKSSLNDKSPIDIHNRIFSSSDFIETPLKRRKFTFPHSTSQLYPITSTPLPKMSTKASPDVRRMLKKQLHIPDIVEDQNISSLVLEKPGGLKLYHFQDHKDTVACSEASGKSRTSDDLENCSPCEATVFPDDQVRDYRIENTDKCRLDRDLIGMKIGLRRSPEELSDSTVHQGKEV
ncbi:uncharacterized protein LOC127721567 [Mytilus californianus]|uniref:uncharacterized protein LOC127721567 n=1 Tax=Mytilus californianus TaxID=6549 RepID=UPI0022456C75|nr:uncharacterized protein LOC127721567 [Mytilus californianus]